MIRGATLIAELRGSSSRWAHRRARGGRSIESFVPPKRNHHTTSQRFATPPSPPQDAPGQVAQPRIVNSSACDTRLLGSVSLRADQHRSLPHRAPTALRVHRDLLHETPYPPLRLRVFHLPTIFDASLRLSWIDTMGKLIRLELSSMHNLPNPALLNRLALVYLFFLPPFLLPSLLTSSYRLQILQGPSCSSLW